MEKAKEKSTTKEGKAAPKTALEMQARECARVEREEELLRSKVAAQRGRDGRPDRRGRLGGREYSRGGARVAADPRRGIPNDDPARWNRKKTTLTKMSKIISQTKLPCRKRCYYR